MSEFEFRSTLAQDTFTRSREQTRNAGGSLVIDTNQWTHHTRAVLSIRSTDMCGSCCTSSIVNLLLVLWGEFMRAVKASSNRVDTFPQIRVAFLF
jgi:hypothetical protein